MMRCGKSGVVVLVWVLLAKFHLASPAPSTPDACPPDSLLKDNSCVCDPSTCLKPPCLSTLTLLTKGTEEPGSCCPTYTCDGCKNDTLLEGKCPCAPGAIFNELGRCECVDKERHLVDGECVCNPRFCEMPRLVCDRKSVPTTIEDGCCRKTRCVPCPLDSESTNLDTADLEDHCVCLPCANDCGQNKTVVIKKKGTGFPGNCCDLYECRPLAVEKENDCVVGDIMYKNGEEWFTDDRQKCTCENGVSLCAPMKVEQHPLDCWDESTVYRHNDTWYKEKGCTLCQCLNGETKCISHYCDVPKAGHITPNESAPCVRSDRIRTHLEQWVEVDGCTECTCHNGKERCNSQPCQPPEEPPSLPGECQPLTLCNKRCPHGFKLNKKGCEVCKCNPSKVSPELLGRYNITYPQLIQILEEYSQRSATTQAYEPTVVLIRRNGGEEVTSTDGGETIITPVSREDDDKSCWFITGALSVLILGIIAGIAAYCLYKTNKRQYSVTPSRGSYHSVTNSTLDNNNTIKIKKSASIRLDNDRE